MVRLTCCGLWAVCFRTVEPINFPFVKTCSHDLFFLQKTDNLNKLFLQHFFMKWDRKNNPRDKFYYSKSNWVIKFDWSYNNGNKTNLNEIIFWNEFNNRLFFIFGSLFLVNFVFRTVGNFVEYLGVCEGW